MPRTLPRLSAFGLLLVVAGCSSPEDDDLPLDFSAFDEAVEGLLAAQGLAGATAAIVHEDRGVVHVAGYGAFAPDRAVLLASTGKILSAGVVLRLADDGIVDLDAPIGEIAEPWADGKGELTLAQLLSNSSGLVGLMEDPTYAPYLCQFVPTGTLRECGETIFAADDEDDRIPPDTAFRYGGAQWQLAGALAEVASGKPWAQLVDEIYVEPCGLTSTGYGNHFLRATLEGGTELLAYPEFFDGDPEALEPTENPNIEGGAYSTASDYAEILLMHLRGGFCEDERVLGPEAVARMQEDRIGEVYDGSTDDPAMPGYGMGWWVSRTGPVVSDPGAYGSIAWLDGERRVGVVLLLEAEAGVGAAFLAEAQPLLGSIFDE